MDRKEIALELRNHGHNCAQAVSLSFCNVLGADPIQTFKMAEGFGFGMGDSEGVCGAISGACMMVGMKKSDGEIDNPKTKRQTYTTISMMKNEFKDRVGALTCKDIKGMETGKCLMSCNDCVTLACELLDKYLLGIYPDGDEPDIKVIKNPNAKF